MKSRTLLLGVLLGAACGGGGVAAGYALGHHQTTVTLTPNAVRILGNLEEGAVKDGITNYIDQRCQGSTLNAVRDPFCADQLGG